MESKGNFKIDKLVDSNFHVWKQKVELVLGDRELIEHILDSDKPEDASELAQWKKNDAKAKAVIGLTLSNDLLEHVRGIETAYEMWEAITDLFQRRTLLNSLSARRRFYSVKMNDGEKALAYISRVRQLAADLKAMDVKVEDGDIAMTVLCGLPSKYEHLIVAIDAATGDSSLTMDFVKSRLLQEEQRMTDRDKSKPAPDAALVTQPNPSNKVSCSHCGKENHTEAKCWKKYPHLQPNRVGRKQTGLAAKSERQTVGDNESSDTEICLTARGRDVSENRNPNWIFDSGSTSHVCYDRRMFSDLKTCKPFVIEIGDKSGVKAIGRGCIRLVLSINGKPRNAVIKDVAYAPTMAFNLLSTRVMNREGGRSVFEENSCHVERGGKVVAEGEIRDGLYCLKTLSQACDPGTDPHTHTVLAADMNLWHQRLAHVHVDGIRNMVRSGVVEGVNIDTTKHVGKCKGCVYGKSSRAPIPKLNAHRASGILDLVHTDVCGPFPEESLGGSLYFVSFIDDCSRYAWVYPIATKADVFSTFTNWLASAENLHKRKLKVLTSGKRLDKLMGESGQGDSPAKLRVLQSDNGGEYISAKMKLFLEKRGISHRLTAPGNPHQNGVAERMNRTLIELVRSMLHHKDLPKHFWAEALAVSVHVRNRVTTSGLSSKSTPYEILFGRKPNLSYLRVFGSRCWYHLGKQKVDKLDRRACEAIMIGYARGARGYKLWDIEESKVVVSRDVQFDECDDFDLTTGTSEVNVPADDIAHERTSEASAQCEKHDHSDAEADSAHSADLGDDSEGDRTPDPEDTEDTDRSDTDESSDDEQGGEDGAASSDQGERPYPRRVRRAPGRWWASVAKALISTSCSDDPKTFAEAVSRPNGKSWMKSMQAELDSLKENECWDLVPRPKGMNVVRSKWVFKTKEEQSANGSLGVRLKSRVVACGYSQIQGVDFSETYAPVVKLTSIRTILSVVAELDLDLHQMDVVTAFLNGVLIELIFMEQPPGFERGDSAEVVCRLKKAIYGLKQSPRQWYARIDEFFVHTLGMERNKADDCVYVRRQGGQILIIALYVDDLLIACSDLSILNNTKRELSNRFKMKDLGESRIILGMDITRDRIKRTLSLNQSRYAQKVIERFGMSSARGQRTPMDPSLDLTDPSPLTSEPYRKAVGSLMYLMVGTRPDLAYCICTLAKYVQTPTQLKWDAVKRVIRYVIHTKHLGLVFRGTTGMKPATVYVDADWAGDVETRRSMSGFGALMTGALVAWGARQQEVVALSSAESEYISLCNGIKETIWLRRLIRGLRVVPDADKPTTVLLDNKAADALAHSSAVNRRNKHIATRFHFNRQAVQDGVVTLKYCPTEEMLADMFTKPLGRVKLQKFVADAGMNETESASTQ